MITFQNSRWQRDDLPNYAYPITNKGRLNTTNSWSNEILL